jgi:hypothetical protein
MAMDCPDFLAKILGTETLQFLCNIQFYFTLSCYIACTAREIILEVPIVAQLVALFNCGLRGPDSIPSKVRISLKMTSVMALKKVKPHFIC